jgi:hypothetical protein
MATVRSSFLVHSEAEPQLREAAEALHGRAITSAQITLDDGETITLPAQMTRAIQHLLLHLAAGDDLSINTLDRDYTFTEALYFLGMTDSYLMKLMEEGEIPFRQDGEEYHLALTDLIAYRLARKARRAEGVRLIQRLSEENGEYGG